MMTIDISTMSALYLYMVCIISGFLYMAMQYYYSNTKKNGYRHFFYFFLFNLLGVICIILRTFLGSFVGTILANSLIIFGYMMIPIGVQRTLGIKYSRIPYYMLTILFVGLFLVFTYLYDYTDVRVFVLNITAIIILVYTIANLHFYKRSRPSFNELMSFSLYIMIVTIILRLVNISIHNEGNDFFGRTIDPFFIVAVGITMLLVIPGLLSIFKSLQEMELNRMTHIDALTGLENRRSMIDKASRIWNQSIVNKVWISVLMLDIDLFKSYNDKFGHPYGDEILVSVSMILREVVRHPIEVVSRYGGDEFTLVLFDCNFNDAMEISADINEKMKLLDFYLDSEKTNQLTLSIGYVSTIATDKYDVDQTISVADECMYSAKKSKYMMHVQGTTLD